MRDSNHFPPNVTDSISLLSSARQSIGIVSPVPPQSFANWCPNLAIFQNSIRDLTNPSVQKTPTSYWCQSFPRLLRHDDLLPLDF